MLHLKAFSCSRDRGAVRDGARWGTRGRGVDGGASGDDLRASRVGQPPGRRSFSDLVRSVRTRYNMVSCGVIRLFGCPSASTTVMIDILYNVG